jgi:hypothetical protein
MPHTSVTEQTWASCDELWRTVRGVEKCPEIMECVRDVQVLDEGPRWSSTSWSVDFEGSILSWVEREERDRPETA